MAIKIYKSGGSIIIKDYANVGSIESINASNFDWQFNNFTGNYNIRDAIEGEVYEIGAYTDIQNEQGVAFTSDSELQMFFSSIAVQNAIVGTNELSLDAWGKSKFIIDKSLIHGLFTSSVPLTMWKEIFNGTEQLPTICTSVNGKLSAKSGATLNDKMILETFRNPRYEPNRGHLYSTAMFIPNKIAAGVREFGLITEFAGVFFRVKSDGNLYAVVRTTIDSITTDNEQLIDTTGVDIEKGNVYDIQFQWRGVGNYKFFLNLKPVAGFMFLGTLTELSIFNPALPASFICENLGDNVELNCGCVDVSSEGGEGKGKEFGSISVDNEAGQVAISGFNIPVIAVRSKKTVNSLRNTRDTILFALSAYSDQRSFLRVWKTRDFTAITSNDQNWADFKDGHLEYITYDIPDITIPMSFDTSKGELKFGARVNIDADFQKIFDYNDKTNLFLTPGDMYVITIHRENGGSANVGATIEFGEEI